MGTCELETDFDGHPGHPVVEHGPQTVGARQRRSRLRVSGLVECDACRRSVHDCAARVVTETLLVDGRLCRPCAFGGLSPGALLGRAEREQCLSHGDVVARGAEGLRRRDGCASGPPSHDRLRRAARARRLACGARRGSTNFPAGADRAPDPRRQAHVRHRPASCARAASRSTARSWRCHPGRGPVEVAPSASASNRSASSGRPVSTRIHAP